MNIATRIIRRLEWWQRGHAWKQELTRAACGDIPFAPFPDVAPASLIEIRRGNTLLDSQLAMLLADRELGSWALDGATLGFFGHLLNQDKPAAILEFGAGASTLAFAHLLRRLHGDSVVRLFSVEQNE